MATYAIFSLEKWRRWVHKTGVLLLAILLIPIKLFTGLYHLPQKLCEKKQTLAKTIFFSSFFGNEEYFQRTVHVPVVNLRFLRITIPIKLNMQYCRMARNGLKYGLLFILLDVAVAAAIGFWAKAMFDLLSGAYHGSHPVLYFSVLLAALGLIILVFVFSVTGTKVLGETWYSIFRQAVTMKYTELFEKFHFHLQHINTKSGRLAESVPRFIAALWMLTSQAVRVSLKLPVFLVVLWMLSDQAVKPLNFPGSLVLIIITFCAVSFSFSWLFGGRELPHLDRQKDLAERAYRKALEKRDFEGIREKYQDIFDAEMRLTVVNSGLSIVQNGSGQIVANLAIILMGAAILMQDASLGSLSQAAQGLGEVALFFLFLQMYLPTIADMKNLWDQLMELEQGFQEAEQRTSEAFEASTSSVVWVPPTHFQRR